MSTTKSQSSLALETGTHKVCNARETVARDVRPHLEPRSRFIVQQMENAMIIKDRRALSLIWLTVFRRAAKMTDTPDADLAFQALKSVHGSLDSNANVNQKSLQSRRDNAVADVKRHHRQCRFTLRFPISCVLKEDSRSE